ncbi:hypothetical protein AVEN_114365-1 [Araneus ventricosus]|uniref:Uncharacterized protein n=1 Tax=Araneus ventricosus TaxID=182803 RepID=A0A4Y2X6S5_ARAVE|nr:hypothetical protein AVEN_114365-1 [Araneus ventricosus]
MSYSRLEQSELGGFAPPGTMEIIANMFDVPETNENTDPVSTPVLLMAATVLAVFQNQRFYSSFHCRAQFCCGVC